MTEPVVARLECQESDERPLMPQQTDGDRSCLNSCTSSHKNRLLWFNSIVVAAVLLIFLAIVVALVVITWPQLTNIHSATGHYEHAAVAADAQQCSQIGRKILEQHNGSAVDAAVASVLCLGVHNAQSCGLGGGFFMVVYDTPTNGMTGKIFESFDAREVAPLAATKDMFMNGTSSIAGGKSIAVPGEIQGLYVVWSRYGRLPWRDLFLPAIDMCRNGFQVGPSLASSIADMEPEIRSTPSLRKLFVKADDTLYKEGDTMKRPTLADTMERLSNVKSIEELMNSDVFRDMTDDIQEYDGIVTIQDFNNYQVKVTPTLSMVLNQTGLIIHTMPPPSAGIIYGFILRLLEGFNLTRHDVADKTVTVETYHKMIESFKFGYALRTYLGDPAFVNNTKTFADEIRGRINLTMTQSVSYYGPESQPISDRGTSHLSILAANGGAVSVTSTINELFGSQRVGRRTGIIFNDEMADFSEPGPYKSGLPPSQENLIEPGKRPMSSMCPSIIVEPDGRVAMVIGASGGSTITTGLAFVTAESLWLGREISQAVNQYRVHHQLLPNAIEYEEGLFQVILDGLKAKGHELLTNVHLHNVVQAIYSTCPYSTAQMNGKICNKNCITAVCDGRKHGKPDGY